MSRTLHPALKSSAAAVLALMLTATTVGPATAQPAMTDTLRMPAMTAEPDLPESQKAAEVVGKDEQSMAIEGIDAAALPAPESAEATESAAPEPTAPESSEVPPSESATSEAAVTEDAGSAEGVTSSEPAEPSTAVEPVTASASTPESASAADAALQQLRERATASTEADAGSASAVTSDVPVAPESAELADSVLADDVDTATIAALTLPVETIDFVVAGVTWDIVDAGEVTDVSLRAREESGWTDWNSMEIHDGDERPGLERTGTEPLVTNGADAIQVRITTVDGDVPAGLKLDLIDPGEAETDGKLEAGSPESPQLAQVEEAAGVSGPAVGAETTFVPAINQQDGLITGTAEATPVATNYDNILKPKIITRAQWGADESIVQDWGTPSTDLQAMYVHHTAGSNNYSESGAYAQIRGIFTYHAKTLNWGDIGYQFLVDKYGNIFQGRRGSIDKPVQGAQAGGFNTDTIGVSAMGNYEEVGAPAAMVSAIERVLAWQAYRYDVNPTGSVTLTQRGKSTARWSDGSRHTVRTILGHRDTNFTSCPGQYLYAKLGSIRQHVGAKVAAAKSSHGEHPGTLSKPTRTSNPYSLSLPGLTARASWGAGSADDYQIMYRAVPHGGGSINSQPWKAGRTTTGTALNLSTDPGETAQFAVRSRRGGEVSDQTYLGQHTGPLYWSNPSISTSGLKSVTVSGGVGNKGMKPTRTYSVAFRINDAAAANRLVLGAKVTSGTAKVKVTKDGKSYGTLRFTAGGTKYQGVDLPTGGQGAIRVSVSGTTAITFTSAAVTRAGQTGDAVAIQRGNCGPQFRDNKPGSGHFTAIQWMACEGISVGYSSDNTFRKNQNVTRGETAQFMYKMTEQTRQSTGKPFKDVSTAYVNAISWFAARKISVGYTDGTFRPNRAVSRGELAAFLYGLSGSRYQGPSSSPFKDLKPTSPNYDAITWLRSQGITSGYADGTFKPSRSISRAETAAFLESFYDGPQRFL
ncbi:S-layer homology domain-containing protein [Citricoccus sp. GCM10030269]|uniref:S-layer homology domain-containing protein n=1 Tax=Citricoccus sp. GCM10030269 TaxID=3273388 RepID=UPI003622A24C